MPVTINGTTGISGVDGSASTPAVQGTDTNTGIFFPAADTIAFGEGGAEAMRIDSSGNVLVGTTTTPSLSGIALGTSTTGKSLTVFSSSSGNNGIVKFIDPNGSAALEFVGGTTSNSIYGYGSRPILFWTNGTERLKIPSDSAGITFPATQSASTDANTLDDYEEGDWTPTLTGGTTAGSTTYTAQNGSYIKIGKQVTVFLEVRVTSATGTGEMRFGGLPFTIANANKYQSCGAVMTHSLNYSAGTSPVFYANPNSTYLNLYISGDDIAWTNQNVVDESQFYIGSITYTAA